MAEQPSSMKILVEWSDRLGRQPTSFTETIGDGAKALSTAMDTIQEIASQVAETLNKLVRDPQQCDLKAVEVEFGLKLDAQAGAIIAKTGAQASIMVKVKWEKSQR